MFNVYSLWHSKCLQKVLVQFLIARFTFKRFHLPVMNIPKKWKICVPHMLMMLAADNTSRSNEARAAWCCIQNWCPLAPVWELIYATYCLSCWWIAVLPPEISTSVNCGCILCTWNGMCCCYRRKDSTSSLFSFGLLRYFSSIFIQFNHQHSLLVLIHFSFTFSLLFPFLFSRMKLFKYLLWSILMKLLCCFVWVKHCLSSFYFQVLLQ